MKPLVNFDVHIHGFLPVHTNKLHMEMVRVSPVLDPSSIDEPPKRLSVIHSVHHVDVQGVMESIAHARLVHLRLVPVNELLRLNDVHRDSGGGINLQHLAQLVEQASVKVQLVITGMSNVGEHQYENEDEHQSFHSFLPDIGVSSKLIHA